MTTAVLFDLDYTLIDYDPDFHDALLRACESAGIAASDDRVVQYHDGFIERQHAFEDDPVVGACRDLCAEHDLSADPETLADAVVTETVDAAYAPAPVRETVTALAADHPLGVVTNGYGPSQRRKLASTGLDDHVETLVSPEQVEAFKPDRAILEEATSRVPADEYVFVGDSLDHDVRAAADLGFETVLVGDRGVDGDPADLPAVDLHLPDYEAFGRLRRLVDR